MVKKLQAIFLTGFIFICGCSDVRQNNSYSDNSALDAEIGEQINNYLIKEEGIIGFGGEVFCDHILIGKEDNKYYIIYSCQEYYQVNDSQVLEGSGTKIPAVISIDKREIISIKKPRSGSAFTNDVNHLFPREIIRKLRSKSSSTDWVSSEKLEMFKEKLKDKRVKSKQLFSLIQKDSVDVNFYGGGTEPFWSIYLLNEEALFINSGIISKLKPVNDFDRNASNQVVVCENSTGKAINIEISKKETFEESADKYYPYEVTIYLGNLGTLKGVGNLKKL